MPDNASFFICSIISIYMISFAAFSAINDPTKPIFNADVSDHVDTTPLTRKKKLVFLQSIFYGEANKSAVINERVVKEGGFFDGILLKAIYKRHIVLEYKKNEIPLQISKAIYIDKVTGDVSDK